MADNADADRTAARPIRNVLVIARQAAGRTIADVAHQIHCQPTQLASWENGAHTPGVDRLAAWADALGYELALMSKPRKDTP